MNTLRDIRQQWAKCHRCDIGLRAKHHVVGEVVTFYGTVANAIPASTSNADVAFVGEAPGIGEDVLGHPFIGPAGRLLRSAISTAEFKGNVCFTNLLACRPGPAAGSNRAPDPGEVAACRERLEAVLQACGAWLVVAVGSEAYYYLSDLPNVGRIKHPSYALRTAKTEEFKASVKEVLKCLL